ncbi:hypothetical protein ADU37_CDS20760 [Thermococcus sp. 2319x1]|nr:hypothetical protein ADU37_CDS20760 [Thermococcus sp. 2319x1]
MRGLKGFALFCTMQGVYQKKRISKSNEKPKERWVQNFRELSSKVSGAL